MAIRDTYKNKFGEKWELEVDEEAIVTKDRTGAIRINKSEIEEVTEIKDYYFLKARTGGTLILSKTKTDNIELIKGLIKSLVTTYGVRHRIELDWRWK